MTPARAITLNSLQDETWILFYLILEDKNPLYRFEKWSHLHKHPFGDNIPSKRSREIFASITEEAKSQFFRLQGKRRVDKEYWAYDITSISSYSEDCAKFNTEGIKKVINLRWRDLRPAVLLPQAGGEHS
ncbi:hypothetical protein FPZ45_18520 [Cohnella terricola]|uniref:Uncharacterized protein n=1 Tax=Cohnella terricola TaxID=1289167 RepID=A0A559JBS3_9BACL|nr:hypothetical protein [Cohnella terricola]TVX97334.1 hypothetical protein FPZ45_18520 [Cohnella terricola]